MIDYQKTKSQKPTEELLNFGIINIDKPTGPTSFSVTDYIRKSLNLSKTSHMGTLDPQVSGVLPILLGRACRLSDYFMHKDKMYIGIMRLHSDIDYESLQKQINKFIGKIIQLPPVRSRVKRTERVREVKHFRIIEKEEKDILFETEVQAGTYIRKLIHDLGLEIGGSHMLELRRIKAGIFAEDNLVNLYDFEKAVNNYKNNNEKELRSIIMPAEEKIKEVLPSAELSEKNLKAILTGKPLTKQDLLSNIPKEIFAGFIKDRFIGVYKPSDEKDIIARPEFVKN